MENIYDVAILGQGPAGITTALYTARANLKTIIFGKNNGKLLNAEIENIFGISSKTSGKDLVNNSLQNLRNFNTVIIDNYITKFLPEKDIFILTDEMNNKYKCKNLVIAFGTKNDNKFSEYVGKGVSYCVLCDGFFYKNKTVVLVCKQNSEFEIKYLSSICSKVYIFSSHNFTNLPSNCVLINDSTVEKCNLENNKLKSITTADNQTIEADGLFIDENITTSSLPSLGIITKNGHITVDENYQTSLNNVFAVGDIVGLPYQIAKACYDGMQCALYIIKKEHQKN